MSNIQKNIRKMIEDERKKQNTENRSFSGVNLRLLDLLLETTEEVFVKNSISRRDK